MRVRMVRGAVPPRRGRGHEAFEHDGPPRRRRRRWARRSSALLPRRRTRGRERRGRKSISLRRRFVARRPAHRDPPRAAAPLQRLACRRRHRRVRAHRCRCRCRRWIRLADAHTSQRALERHAPARAGAPGERPLKVEAAVLCAVRARRQILHTGPCAWGPMRVITAEAAFAARAAPARRLLHGDCRDDDGGRGLAHALQGRAHPPRVGDAFSVPFSSAFAFAFSFSFTLSFPLLLLPLPPTLPGPIPDSLRPILLLLPLPLLTLLLRRMRP